MAHVFDPKKMHKLDSPERRKELPPEETLQRLGIKTGDTVVDLGCGIGYFTIPIGGIVGDAGKVIGIDIAQEMLNETRRRADEAGITNVDLRLAENDGVPVSRKEADFILIVNVLHEFHNPQDTLEKCAEALKPGGRLAIIEWAKKETEHGPPLDHRISKEEIAEWLKRYGFTVADQDVVAKHLNLFIAVAATF
jgi:ubiquinone/menaquinone biosynthesis C-methylase UbiE